MPADPEVQLKNEVCECLGINVTIFEPARIIGFYSKDSIYFKDKKSHLKIFDFLCFHNNKDVEYKTIKDKEKQIIDYKWLNWDEFVNLFNQGKLKISSTVAASMELLHQKHFQHS